MPGIEGGHVRRTRGAGLADRAVPPVRTDVLHRRGSVVVRRRDPRGARVASTVRPSNSTVGRRAAELEGTRDANPPPAAAGRARDQGMQMPFDVRQFRHTPHARSR